MKLSKKQFEVLVAIEKNKKDKYSQRDIANDTNFSVGLVNKILNELTEEKLVDHKNNITEKGLKELEPLE